MKKIRWIVTGAAMTGALFFCGCSADVEVDNSKSAEKRKSVSKDVRKVNPQAGVCGWCNCNRNNMDNDVAQVGPWLYGSFGREKYDSLGIECDLAYFVCCKCGRVLHPSNHALRKEELGIFDVSLYKKWLRQNNGDIWRKALVPLKKRQDELAALPNGRIVVRGKCVCKKGNILLVHVGRNGNDFYVCTICGHVRPSDDIDGIPCTEEGLSMP